MGILSDLPRNVHQFLVKLIPSSILNEIVCFVFNDNHPRDNQNIDVTICVESGEVQEFYQRETVSSLSLNVKAKEIRIIRNIKCELFYLVSSEEELFIISRKQGKLCVVQKVNEVESFMLDDTSCRGQACLKVVRKDDAVQLRFDEKLVNLGDRAVMLSGLNAEDSLPVLTQLKRKLTETKYCVRCNEKILKEFSELRQGTTFSVYQKIQYNADDSFFNDELKMMNVGLNIEMQSPWVKICNQKIIMAFNVINKNKKFLHNVQILLHGTSLSSIIYCTKLFTKTENTLCWTENNKNVVQGSKETAIVFVMDVNEIKRNCLGRIDFNGVLGFTMDDKEYIVPFEDVHLSSLDTMGEEFDVLSSAEMDNENVMLAILASTQRTDLKLTHIQRNIEPPLTLKLFCQYLHMEFLRNTENILIHRNSPYHILNGTMIVCSTTDKFLHSPLSVYTRSLSQLLDLLQLAYDSIPYRIVITTSNQIMTAKREDMSQYNEDMSHVTSNVNYEGYATSIVNQTSMISEYLDQCNVNMNQSKDPAIQSKIGHQIDLLAGGVKDFLKFKSKILEEATKGINSL